MEEPLIRDISDTARWVAVYRARETERPDAAFRDPFARRLAGERGEQIARAMPMAEEAAWSFIARTHLFDRFILRAVEGGADLVVNLAAGLDARPKKAIRDTYARTARERRGQRLRTFSRMGVDRVEISTDRPYVPALLALFNARSRRN